VGPVAFRGTWYLNDLSGKRKKTGDFYYLQEIARFAPVPDPGATGPPFVGESWLVTHTGQVDVEYSTGDDHRWEGAVHLYFNDNKSLLFDPTRLLTAIRYEHGTPTISPKIDRQDRATAFGPLAVLVALAGMHTGDDSQSTYGLGAPDATILPTPKPKGAPSYSALRPHIKFGVGIWGEDAHLHTISFELTVNAEYGLGVPRHDDG
jgi:hypothetical protein